MELKCPPAVTSYKVRKSRSRYLMLCFAFIEHQALRAGSSVKNLVLCYFSRRHPIVPHPPVPRFRSRSIIVLLFRSDKKKTLRVSAISLNSGTTRSRFFGHVFPRCSRYSRRTTFVSWVEKVCQNSHGRVTPHRDVKSVPSTRPRPHQLTPLAPIL